MTTTRRRAFVSIAAAITLTLALSACLSAPSRPTPNRAMSTDDHPPTIRFDNLERETVDVYLIGEKREWQLGRVAPGVVAHLRVPEGALTENSTMVRLAVLTGERRTLQAARHPRAALSIKQSSSALFSQRWTFSGGELTPLQQLR